MGLSGGGIMITTTKGMMGETLLDKKEGFEDARIVNVAKAIQAYYVGGLYGVDTKFR